MSPPQWSPHAAPQREFREQIGRSKHLKSVGADIEDPGNEIGPEGPGSKNIGLWFHDPDGYRWELSVLRGK